MFEGRRKARESGAICVPRFDACFAISTAPVLGCAPNLKFRYGFCRPAGAAALHLASGLELVSFRRRVRTRSFGCHLIPRDAPARACAYWCRNPTNAVARPVPFPLDLGPTAGRHLCQCFADRRPAQRLPALGLGNFDIKNLSRSSLVFQSGFEFRVIIAGLGEDLEQVCDMNFGYCWFSSPLPVQASDVRRPTSPTTRSPSFWCRLWHRVLGRGPRFAVAVEVVG